MRNLVVVFCVVAGMTGLGGCGGKASSNKLTLAGSTAFTPVAQKLADAFKAKHAGVTIDIQSVGSGVGIKNVNDGIADVGMADLPEIPEEAKALKAFSVSRDGIAVVVHPSNGVTSLSMEQVAKIFSGEITNWKDVGGADAEITVICRATGSGSRVTFDTLVKIKGKVTRSAQEQSSNGACRGEVAKNPKAISYVTFVQVDASVKALKLGGVDPKIETVKDGKYGIAAIDYLLTKGEPTGLAKEFIDFVMGAEGQKIILDCGLAPVK
ncbi:MAG: phosphate transport system substrate-binding [Planctomycetota bacterium]|nr:MAG: phosphate transport system substrate-binding [Planctomycetota bacterium]